MKKPAKNGNPDRIVVGVYFPAFLISFRRFLLKEGNWKTSPIPEWLCPLLNSFPNGHTFCGINS